LIITLVIVTSRGYPICDRGERGSIELGTLKAPEMLGIL
jgi:hypothetical protein